MTAGYPADHQEINPVSQQQYQSSSSSTSNCNATMTTAYTTNDPTSPITLDLSLSKTSTTDVAMCDDHSPNGTVKDEDDEDDDDVDDRIDTQQDPERLKAFNVSSHTSPPLARDGLNLKMDSFFFVCHLDVCSTICWRKSRPDGPHFTTATWENSSNYR